MESSIDAAGTADGGGNETGAEAGVVESSIDAAGTADGGNDISQGLMSTTEGSSG